MPTPHECPHCHVALEEHEQAMPLDERSRRHAPRAGDFVVCFECGGVAFATDNEGGRRLPTADENADLDKDPRVMAARMMRELWEMLGQQIRFGRNARNN